MSDLHNDLLDLVRTINDARDLIEQAGRLACSMACPNPENPADEWPAMGLLADRLAALHNQFAGLVPDDITKAAAESEAYLDHMADLEDGLSY